jgi:hypothetical protein
MSKTSQASASLASTLSLENLSSEQVRKMIEHAAIDPGTADLLRELQELAYESLEKSVQHMITELNEIEGPAQEKMPAGPISMVALASAARQREAAGKQKREFAEFLVIGALINRDNPDWDIFDEAATPSPAGNGLLALLQMKLPAPADTPA